MEIWIRCWLHFSEVATTPDSSDSMLKFTRTSSAGQPCQQRKKWARAKLGLRTGTLGAVSLNHRALDAISGIRHLLCHILLEAVGKGKLLSQIPW